MPLSSDGKHDVVLGDTGRVLDDDPIIGDSDIIELHATVLAHGSFGSLRVDSGIYQQVEVLRQAEVLGDGLQINATHGQSLLWVMALGFFASDLDDMIDAAMTADQASDVVLLHSLI